jgi:hypothetical protein
VIGRGGRRILLFSVALALVAVLWEMYKVVGPADGGEVFGWAILPRANDRAMPHVWDMVDRAFDPGCAPRTGPCGGPCSWPRGTRSAWRSPAS